MKKPLVYFSVAVGFGCACTLISYNNLILGAVLAASFLFLMLLELDKQYFFLITIFFIAGTVVTLNYFSYKSNLAEFNNVRIVDKEAQYILGSFHGRKIVFYGDFDKANNGELINLSGEFEKNFNLEKGIIGTVKVKKITKYNEDIITKIYIFKEILLKKFQKNLKSEDAAFIMAICFGDTKELSTDQKTDFQKLGVIHAISVSGFHLAIIYKIFEATLGIYPGIALSLIYVIFTGGQPSTVRSFLMIFILKLSKKINKNYDVFSSIGLSAILILLVKPYYIMDIGFNLSYLATISIVVFNSVISKKMSFLPQKLNESISISVSSQILSLPYAAFTINNISLGFLLGNIVLLPMYTAIVIVGNLAMCFSSMETLFNIICKFINIILTCIQGATYCLLKVCPEARYFTIWEAWILTLFIISILIGMKGVKKAEYVLSLSIAMIIFNNYNVLPQIIYINSGRSDSIVIKYRSSAFLLTGEGSGRTLSNYKNQFGVTRVISTTDGDNKLMLGDKYVVYVSEEKSYNEKYKTMELTLIDKRREILFTRDGGVSIPGKKYYDIIKLPKDKKIPVLDYNYENVFCYYVFENNIIKMNK